jgi:XTP/dITP diphosphohydrolase
VSAADLVLVVASANPDKVTEIRAILREVLPDVELRPRPDHVGDVDETGDTLEENARLKAVAVSMATGLPAVADDTGLEVVALDGAPGVVTARFAGPAATYADNVAKLLASMTGVADRRAQFRTVALVRWPDGREVAVEGAVDGRIAESARGESGFGYDPVFEPEGGGGATFAELGEEGKRRLSHRARAFRALALRLEDVGG